MAENFGFWKQTLKSWGIKTELIASMSWKAAYGLTKRKGRAPMTAWEFAKRKWPEILKFKYQDGVAVALLLAGLAKSVGIGKEGKR
jgi:hypothetical protein